MYTVNFSDDDAFNLACNAVLHMAKSAAADANIARHSHSNSAYADSMEERSHQYFAIFNMMNKTQPTD